jgi:hypothetical protein
MYRFEAINSTFFGYVEGREFINYYSYLHKKNWEMLQPFNKRNPCKPSLAYI